MSSIIKRRPSPAMVVAMLALFVAFSGTATAAYVMTGKNIKNGTVTGKDVKDRSLGTRELSKKAISSLRGAVGGGGSQGSQGPAGPPGPTKAYADNTAAEITGQLTRILEVQVDAGSYTAQANLELHAVGPKGSGECRFRALGGTPTLLGFAGELYLGDNQPTGFIDSRNLSFGGAFKMPQAGVVELACKATTPLATTGGDLVVTQVDKVVVN